MKKYNHDSEDIDEAVGVSLQKTYEKLVGIFDSNKKDLRFSENVETLEKKFTPKELAVLVSILSSDLNDANNKLDALSPLGMSLDASKISPLLESKLEEMADRAGGVNIEEFMETDLQALLEEVQKTCMCSKCVARREQGETKKQSFTGFPGEGGQA